MCNWRKWILPGVIATAVLTALAMLFHSGSIQNDLTAKATDALEAEHPWAAVALDGRDLTLTGVAPDEAAQAAATQIADSAYDVRVVANQSTLPPIASPYPFRAIKSADGIALTGNVPNEAVRTEIVGAAETTNPGIAVTDEMTIARGAPAGFAGLAAFGLTQLGGLADGEASLSDTDYSITGTAATVDAFDAEIARVADALPEGGALASAEIAPPTISPYTWSAAKAEDGSITLDGFAPSVDARDAVEAAIVEANPDATVTNNLRIAAGAPEGYAALTALGATQLGALTSGEASLSDAGYSVSGVAASLDDFEAETARVAGDLPEGGTLALAEIAPATISPYTWSAAKAEDGSITLDGFAPSVDARDAVEAAVVEANPDATVTNNLRIAAGAPEGFAALTALGATQLGGFTSGEANLADAGYSVAGVAADPDAYDAETLRTAGDLPGGGTLVSSAIEPAAVSPYIWSADKSEDGAITLNGFAPSEDVRQRIGEATIVGNPDATVTNNLRIAAGAPDNFDAITDFGIDQLPDLASGSISLTDDEYAINGAAETSESYEAALFRASNELPAGSNLSIAAISPPLAEGVYNWGAAKGADGSIRLTGLMPDLEAKQRIAARAAQVNPGATIDDQMRVAAGAPDGFVASAETSLGFLPQFEVGAVQIADTEMSVQGRAADGDSFDAANLVGTDLPEGINLETEISLPVASGPYQVVANKSADVVTLQGFAPSRDAKDKIVAAAEGLGVNVVDRIQLASGAPDGLDWGAAGAYAVSGLQNTSTGRATLAGNSVTVDADTANGNAYAAAIADWDRPLPAGLSIGTEAIRLPVASPFNWEATFTDRLSIDGVVPSEEVKAANVAEAQRLFGENVRVVDTQDLAGGAPRGFEAATSVGLNSISRMEQAYARVTDNRLEVVGTAFTPSARTDIERKVINGVPPGFTGVANISVRPAPLETGGLGELNAPTCQDELNGVLAGGQIQFETNEAVINEGSFGLLDRLAYTAQACPDANIEVSGHTDADGAEDYNQQLSERRAVAVVNYLVVAGVSSGRLSAVGFGEAQPIASNDTAEGKAQNRRIEFTVQQ